MTTSDKIHKIIQETLKEYVLDDDEEAIEILTDKIIENIYKENILFKQKPIITCHDCFYFSRNSFIDYHCRMGKIIRDDFSAEHCSHYIDKNPEPSIYIKNCKWHLNY